MSQTLVDISKIKDFDAKAAIDSLATSASTGQLPGTTTNDAAVAGHVGEFIYVEAPGVAATATVTTAVASPGVVSWTAHGLSAIAPVPVVFTNSGGGLPTGLTAGTVYYTIPSTVTTNSFEVATTIAHAFSGTAINFTGSSTGTQTVTCGCALNSTAVTDVTGLSLTAGDWDVWGQIVWDAGSTTTSTIQKVSINTTAATLTGPGKVHAGSETDWLATTQTATNGLPTRDVPMCRMSLSATTTIFLTVQATFATSTLGAWGFLAARRMR